MITNDDLGYALPNKVWVKTPDHRRSEVWLRIFCAVAGCHNADIEAAERWADKGILMHNKRFP